VNKSWQRLADLPYPVTHAVPAVDGKTIWIAGGFMGDNPGPALKKVWKYNIDTNKWTRGPDLPQKRAGAGFVRLGRKLHYIGGLKEDRGTSADDHWVLDLDNATVWTKAAPIPRARNHFSAAEFNGKIYVLGGQIGHHGSPGIRKEVDWAEAYDPQTNTWTKLANLPYGRSHSEPGTFVTGGKIVIFGGRTEVKTALYNFTAYDPETDSWTELPAFKTSLNAAVAVPVGDKLIIANGAVLPRGIVATDEMYECELSSLGISNITAKHANAKMGP